MYLPQSYKNSDIWLTIDVERVEDANFGVTVLKPALNIDYEQMIDKWFTITNESVFCAFVLGDFAKKYPTIIQNLSRSKSDIACHGMHHDLVYKQDYKKWRAELSNFKKLLEDLSGKEVVGYRSPSWSLPFEKKYYETLIEEGFLFSSSYFPLKTYMYGNSINKKNPFVVSTESGEITEIPVPKYIIPFSGGFYMRVLPKLLISFFMKQLKKECVKPVIYIHPYELMDGFLIQNFKNEIKIDKSYLLTFVQYRNTYKKLSNLLDRHI